MLQGHNPSYIWRSLMWSCSFLEADIYWRIGAGKSIITFDHKWVVTKFKSNLRWLLNTYEGPPTVQAFIEYEYWDITLLHATFSRMRKYCKFPFLARLSETNVSWFFMQRGTIRWKMGIVLVLDYTKYRKTYQRTYWQSGGNFFGPLQSLLRSEFFGGELLMAQSQLKGTF